MTTINARKDINPSIRREPQASTGFPDLDISKDLRKLKNSTRKF